MTDENVLADLLTFVLAGRPERLTQAAVAPPTFVLFTNQTKPLHFSYQRFLENRLRDTFDFIGTPIRFTQRLKKRESRGALEHETRRGEKRTPRHSEKRGSEKQRDFQLRNGQLGKGKRRSKTRPKRGPKRGPKR